MSPHAFGKIEFPLLLCGHQIFPKNRCQSILQVVLLIASLSKVVIAAGFDFRNYLKADHVTVFHFSDTFFHCFCVVFHIVIQLKLRSIAHFIRQCSPLCQRADVQRLKHIELRNAICYWIYFLIQNLVLTCLNQPFGVCPFKREHTFFDRDDPVTMSVAIISYVAYAHEVLVSVSLMGLVLCFYNYCRAVKQVAISYLMRRLCFLVSNNRSRTRESEFVVIASITRIQDSFDETFSIFPFLVLAANFVQTSGYLLYMLIAVNETTNDRISMVGLSIAYLSVPFGFCLTVSNPKETKKQAAAIIQCLEQGCMRQCEYRLIRLMERVVDRKESGCLFVMDGGTILVYAGQIISFAVIFLQLMPSNVSVSH